MSSTDSLQTANANGKSRLMTLPPELRYRIYELVILAKDSITAIDIYPEDRRNGSRPYLRQPAISRVSKELRHETLGVFYGGKTFHVPLASTCYSGGMDSCSDDDDSDCGSGCGFFDDGMERFCDFRKHVAQWFRINAGHLKLIKTLTMGICRKHSTNIKVTVTGSAMQCALMMPPEAALLGTCWAIGVPGHGQLAARVETVLGTGTARQPYLTLDVCIELLDVMEKYGRNCNCVLREDESEDEDEDEDDDDDDDEEAEDEAEEEGKDGREDGHEDWIQAQLGSIALRSSPASERSSSRVILYCGLWDWSIVARTIMIRETKMFEAVAQLWSRTSRRAQ
ncbi:hypothetical protein LTR12_004824 [Friedmanniomyces endolithicus]|nr:hypothetical protein LTR74_011274 [Friedmanniomyces endolithicus]KAK1820798.1 hypothetical protein LTR12_004824 [Friedmanniomyces endolithicus]